MKISRLPVTKCLAGEGPLWDVEEQMLYLVDLMGSCILRYDPISEGTRRWAMPGSVGSLAIRRRGCAIVAINDAIHTVDLQSGATSPLASLPSPSPEAILNDGKVDRRGRFVVGSTHKRLIDPIGHLYSLDERALMRRIDSGICCSNGPCWSPDNETLYFSDSIPRVIYAYDYDIESGDAEGRRIWATTDELGGIPDGATVDRDGLIWMAIFQGSKIVAFRPDGSVERTVPMPVSLPSSVMFGGPNLDLLYVTSFDPTCLGWAAEEGGGYTYVIEGLGARGIAEPRYSG
jgi:L-arabinonolactonase